MTDHNLQRSLGRVESRVSSLTEQIGSLRKEVSTLSHTIETDLASHRERIAALESFRRWAIGLMTGVVLSAVAAVVSRFVEM